jgi:hypothetical protein
MFTYVFVAFFYAVFGIPVSFSSFFSTILHAFFFSKQKQIRRMPSRLIFILFLHVQL